MRGGNLVSAQESVVYSHYLMKYNLLKVGFSWTEIDNLGSKEVEMIMAIYSALATKEQGFG